MSVEEMPPYKYGSVQRQVMKIDRITYDRVVNLGNYQTEKLSASAQIEEGQDPAEAFKQLKDFVYKQLGLLQEVVSESDYPEGF